MTRTRARWSAAVLAVLAAAGLPLSRGVDAGGVSTTEPSSTAPDSGELDALIAAAQEEGSVTFYGAATENVLADAAAAFSAKYDIDAQFIRLSSADLQQRFFAEMDAETCATDVVIQSDTGTGTESMFELAAESGWIVPDLADAGIPGFPNEFPTEWLRGSRVVLHIQPWLMAYNSDIVAEADAPEQWPDLLDPKFKDLILLPDPRASGAYIYVWLAVLDEYGEEWFEGLLAQNPRVFEAGVPAAEALGAGEGGVMGPAVGSQIQGISDRGAPLVVVVPDVTSGVEMSGALVNPDCAAHPNAGRLLLHYLMSPEGNAVFSDYQAVFSVYDTEGLPSGYVSPHAVTEDEINRVLELLGVD